MLWVRPWYVQAQQTPIPQLNYVVVAFGDQMVRARTLEAALKLAFPESQLDLSTTVGPLTPVAGGEDNGEAPATDNGAEEPTEPIGSDGSETVEELLAEANVLYAQANAALADADLATYQAKINEAFALVTRAEELSGVNGVTEDSSPDTSPDTTDST